MLPLEAGCHPGKVQFSSPVSAAEIQVWRREPFWQFGLQPGGKKHSLGAF